MPSLPDIYQYTDYRTYLRDWYEASKKENSFVSYRYLASKTSVDAGYLAHVFQGTKHLSESSLPAFVRLLRLDNQQKRYLESMVDFNKARKDKDIRERFQQLMSLRDHSARVVSQQQYRYWMHWYIPAIRLTLLNFDFSGDLADLAARITPRISVREAGDALQVLLDLELVKKREDGVYEVQDTHLSTGDAWHSAAIREFQSYTLELAQLSLRNHPPELREIATLSLAIPRDEISTLQEMMRDFRSRVAKWALGLQESDCVIQLNLACFPMSLPPGNLDKKENSEEHPSATPPRN